MSDLQLWDLHCFLAADDAYHTLKSRSAHYFTNKLEVMDEKLLGPAAIYDRNGGPGTSRRSDDTVLCRCRTVIPGEGFQRAFGSHRNAESSKVHLLPD